MLLLIVLAPLAVLVLLNLPVKALPRKVAFALILLLALAQVGLLLFRPDLLRGGGGSLDQLVTGQSPKVDPLILVRLAADSLSLVLLLSIGIVAFATALVGRAMIADEKQRFYFFNVLLVSMIGMNGAVLVSDLFSLYVFLEVTAVSSFLLIALNRDQNALEGAFKYVVMSAVATVLMLTGIALLLVTAHGTSFAAVREAVRWPDPLARIALGAFVCGLFIKGGLVPFHGWVIGAYSAASAPVSVLLAGAATKVSGIYALAKLSVDVFAGGASAAFGDVMLLVGAASIVVGAFAAIVQTDLKRLLAWSSISQVGYIVLGLGCGTPLAIAGAVFHLFNHAIFKSLLFVNSASVEQRLQTTDMERMGGLGARMPWTATTNVVGLLSAAGVPPLSGFWSKLLIIVALWQAGHTAYAILAALMSVVTLGYLLWMQRKIFFGKERPELSEVREAGFGLVLAAASLAGVTIGAGMLFPLLFRTFLLQAGGR